MSLTKIDALLAGIAAIETLLRRPDGGRAPGAEDARAALVSGLRVLFDRSQAHEAEHTAATLAELDQRLKEREAAILAMEEDLLAREGEIEGWLRDREAELHLINDRLTSRELSLMALEQRLQQMAERLRAREEAIAELEARRQLDDAAEAERRERLAACLDRAASRFFEIGLDLAQGTRSASTGASSLSPAGQAVLHAIVRLALAFIEVSRVRSWLQRGAWRRPVHRDPALQAVSDELRRHPREAVKEAIRELTEEPTWSRIVAPIAARQARARAPSPSTSEGELLSKFREIIREVDLDDAEAEASAEADDGESRPLHVVGEEGK